MRRVPFRVLKYLFFKKYPAEITFFVTAACNFRCRHCFSWRKREKGSCKEELSLDEIGSITRTIPPFVRLSLSGGEPFLRPDLVEICKAFYNNCQVPFITIPTNAFLTEKIVSDVEQILKDCPGLFLNIGLSVDEYGERRDYIVGRENTTASLLETAEKLKALQKKYDNLGLGVITVQTHSNENRLVDIYEFCLETMKVDNFGFGIVRGGPREEETNVDLEIYERFTQKISKDKRFPMFKFRFSNFFAAKKKMVYKYLIKVKKEKKYLSSCFSGRLRAVIDEVGNVYPCEVFQFHHDSQKYLFGNLRKNDLQFKKVFFSPRAQEIKRYIKRTKCFCTHECDLETTILFNPRFFPRLVFEALKSSLGKRKN